MPVTITVDAVHPIGSLKPVWRFFGYNEANYTYMPDGRKLVGELAALGTPTEPAYFRCHHLLTSGDGRPGLKWCSTNAYTEDAAGYAVYDWTMVDRIFDTHTRSGGRPYVEVGFTPEAMSTNAAAYPLYRPAAVPLPPKAGQAWPPKDCGKWGELIDGRARHTRASMPHSRYVYPSSPVS